MWWSNMASRLASSYSMFNLWLALSFGLQNLRTKETLMALPIGLPPEKLHELTEKQLHVYFCKYARHMEDSPRLKYAIQFGSRAIMSEDTADLWVQFQEAVKGYKRPHLPHLFYTRYDKQDQLIKRNGRITLGCRCGKVRCAPLTKKTSNEDCPARHSA